MQPKISVVVPCYNAANTLHKQLLALASQSIDVPYEVLVVDNKSTDGTKELVNEFALNHANFNYVTASSKQGVNHARNIGVRQSRSSLVVLCDSDDVVSDNWLDGLFELFNKGFNLVGGPLVHKNGEQVVELTGLNYAMNWLPFPSGANCGFTKQVFEQLGGFDETYVGGGDETEFFWRAQIEGHDLGFSPKSFVYYSERTGTSDSMRQKFLYGKSHARLFSFFRKHGMPRTSALRSCGSLLKATLILLLHFWHKYKRGKALSVISLHFGRLMGSIQSGVFYL